MHIFHQVEAPRHRENGTEAWERRDERAGLDWSRVDEIWLDVLDHAAKIQDQPRQVAPAELAPSARPEDLFDFRGDGAILDLSRSALKSHIKDLVICFCEGREKPMVVRGVVEREVDDFHEIFLNTKGHEGDKGGLSDEGGALLSIVTSDSQKEIVTVCNALTFVPFVLLCV
jgi:hypothetical protein